MASRNIYLDAKRDLSCVVYWIIRTSNSIINMAGGELDTDGCGCDSAPKLNTTGEITAADLLALCKVIPEHLSSVPPVIFHLLESVIDAHMAANSAFQQVVTKDPDPEVDRSYEAHKRLIDDLFEAFCALGGEDWMPEESEGTDANFEALHDKDELDRLLLENEFADLGLGGANDGDQGAEGSQDKTPEETSGQHGSGSTSQKRRQARPGKGKRGRWAQKLKKQHKAAAKKESMSNIPLENCRIIQDTEEPISPDYLMAVYTLVHQWVDLRAYVQGQWHRCAYDGLNTAVAGGVSNLAIDMVRQTWSDTIANFPGQDNFEFLSNVLTRGDPQEVYGKLSPRSADQQSPESENVDTAQDTVIDVKELFMLHTFGDLVDFVEDFQKTRSGKPTKRMLKEIRDWDPDLALWETSNEDRIRWRRAYTINWLYDLVNFFLSTTAQEGAKRGETVALADVDWSLEGPWRDHWGLLGLNTFARLVTSLAMQKQGTKFRGKILPPDVFQLQCIVDSFMVSRGWSIRPLKGHVLNPPAWNFRPRRDLDCFLGADDQSPDKGWMSGVSAILKRTNQDITLYPDVASWQDTRAILGTFLLSFRDFFKAPEHMDGLPSNPPSRFLHRSTNGLWEYSPLLCGIGLMEGLNLAYITSMQLWDCQGGPTLFVHLHNMLVKRGYLKQPVPLFAHLEKLFKSAMFLDGRVPSSHFEQALRMHADATPARTALTLQQQHRAHKSQAFMAEFNGRQVVMLVEKNLFFRAKSNLLLYQESDWSIDAIQDAALPLTSTLLLLRLARSKQVWNPALSEWQFEETDLVRRVKAQGISDQFLRQLASVTAEHSASGLTPHEQLMPEDFLQLLLKISTALRLLPNTESQPSVATEQRQAAHLAENSGFRNEKDASKRLLLACAMADLFDDVCGALRPLSSLNYAAMLAMMMDQFKALEDELDARRNPLYVLIYEQQLKSARKATRRYALTCHALREEDEECLRVMADMFERTWGEVASYTYWQNSQPFEPTEFWDEEKEDIGANACSVM